MRSKSIPDLPKLIFGQIAYFVAPANEKHTFCIPQIIKNLQKPSKNASNACTRKKEGLQGRLFAIFGDFGGPQGGPKITKNRKNAFQKIDRKKGRKKEGDPHLLFRMMRVGGKGSAQGIQDSAQEGSCQVRKTSLKHASTPGGVRRI